MLNTAGASSVGRVLQVKESFDPRTRIGCGKVKEIADICQKEEIKLVNSTMGASMMEPEFREITNRMGFCKIHQKMVLNTDSKLSVALVYHTHMKEMMHSLNDIRKSTEGKTL